MIYWIFTHNTRIQCLLNLIRTTLKQIRFKNCAIIRIELSQTQITVKLIYSGELEESEQKKIFKKPYYVTREEYDLLKANSNQYEDALFAKGNETGSEDESFAQGSEDDEMEDGPSRGGKWPFMSSSKVSGPSLEEPLDYSIPDKSGNFVVSQTAILNVYAKLKLKLSESHIFYLIRHGQADHNTSFSSHTSKDTSLTQKGQHQAKNAGIAFLNYLIKSGELYEEVNIFVSDLKRTRETGDLIIVNMMLEADLRFRSLKSFLQKDNPESSLRDNPELMAYAKMYDRAEELNEQKFVVLPCASEISQLSPDGNCDQKNADASVFKKLGAENYPSCTSDDIKRGECIKISRHAVDWNYYLMFYGQTVRAMRFEQKSSSDTRQYCRNTNMLAEAIRYDPTLTYKDVIQASENRLGGKTKRKNRKTRRRKSSRK